MADPFERNKFRTDVRKWVDDNGGRDWLIDIIEDSDKPESVRQAQYIDCYLDLEPDAQHRYDNLAANAMKLNQMGAVSALLFVGDLEVWMKKYPSKYGKRLFKFHQAESDGK